MRAINGLLSTILVLIAATGLVQCGNQKSKTANVVLTQVPNEPIIITADVTGNDGKKSVAPWFDFTLRIKNGAEQSFVIVAVMAEISITDQNGATSTKEYAADPGQSNFENDALICHYGDFGTWTTTGAESDKFIKITHPNTDCPNGVRIFRVDALAKPSGNSYRYRVKVKPLGYFVDSTGLPQDRFEKDKTFYTQ